MFQVPWLKAAVALLDLGVWLYAAAKAAGSFS
jgi:hypothetical protein